MNQTNRDRYRLFSSARIPIRRATVFAGSIKTSYLAAGSGYPVILIHGGGAGALAWHSIIHDLAGFFSVIAPDLVGYGESDKPHASYDRQYFSQWLRDFMDGLGLDKCFVVGHSLGGAIALQFASDYPDRVERLALVCPAGLGLSFPLVPILYGLLLYSFPSGMTSRRLHTRLVHNPECLDESFIEYAEEVCRKPGGCRAFWEGCFRAVMPIPFDRLKRVTHRTMFIWGAEDRVFPPAHARRVMRVMPHASLHVIPQAGHIPFFDQPIVFRNVLVQFLRQPA